MSSSRQVFLVVAAFSLAVACGSGGGGEPGPTPTSMVRVAASDSQVGPAGQALGTSMQVVVRDQDSNPMAGVSVNWAAASGGGSVAPGTSSTDINGIASTTRTLGPNAGVQTTTASRSGLTTVTFTSIAQVQGATQIQANGGTPQTDTVLSTLATPLSVLVRNHLDAPVAGVIVTFTAAGGDSVNGATSAVDTTDGGGIASVVRKLGPTTGTRAVQATVTGLIGSPVSFSATATPGNPSVLVKTAGDGGSGVINGQVTYTVTARDSHGNGTSGVTIDWAVATGGGSISPAQNTTGSNGTASATRTLSGSEGSHTATAMASAIPATVTFTTNAITAPATADVSVGNNFFDPASATIAAGGSVTWTWVGLPTVGHNVTFGGGAGVPANCANETAAGATCTRTFTTGGTFNYSCTNHGGMNGTVTVVP